MSSMHELDAFRRHLTTSDDGALVKVWTPIMVAIPKRDWMRMFPHAQGVALVDHTGAAYKTFKRRK